VITSDLFPTNPNLRFYVGITTNQFSCDCTYYFNDSHNINFSNTNDLDGYYLGWMQPEDLPLCILTTSNHVVEENGYIKFNRTNPTENYRIGYGFADNNHQYPCQLIERNGTFTTSNLSGIAAFNTFYPEFFGNPRSISFNFVYGIYEEDGETFKYYTQANDRYRFTDWTEFLSFCNGETSLTIPIRDSQLVLTKDDVWETGYVQKTMENGDSIVFFTTSIFISGWNIHNASWTFNDYSTLLPIIKFASENDDTMVSSVLISRIIGGSYGNYNKGTPWSISYDMYGRVANPIGSFEKSRLDSDDMKDRVLWDWIDEQQGGTVVYYYGYYARNIQPIIPFRQLANYVMLSAREGTRTGQYSYHLGDSYATDVTENDQFLGKWKTGNITNQEFKNSLRPWQYGNIQDNEFKPDDVPPYVPPGPTPGGDDNSETGDKIPNQFGRNVGVTSNFITQYLMTQGQISKLGEVLWTSWADDTVTMDMVENFYGKLHDATGSWNVSSALQFLVSCRMFPMSLATLVGTTSTTSIPIGTGAFALQCGTSSEPTFFIANESVAVLNCGDIQIPRKFGDYRDFDNTNITAYLPYCGSVQLSPQDVVGKWLGCTYAIDLFDGSCKAFLYTLSGNDVGYQSAYYNVAIKEGQCGFLIPMSATQAGEVASRRKVDSYVDGSMLFNAGSTMLDGTMRIASGDGLGAIGADVSRLANLGFAYNTLSAQRMGRAGIAAPTIAGGSGFADFMQPASPYIQIRRSHYQMPIQYENSVAYPTNAQNYGNLSQFTGFVQCKNVDVHGFTCHEEERSAIKALLESGVYL
jgi:hypothetical protein